MGIGSMNTNVVLESMLTKGEVVKKGQLLSFKDEKLVKATGTFVDYYGIALNDCDATADDTKIQFIHTGYVHKQDVVVDSTITLNAVEIAKLRGKGLYIKEGN